jgi:TonB-dependent receptor
MIRIGFMNKTGQSGLLAITIGCLLGLPVMATAQDDATVTDADDDRLIEEVVVEGYRQSIQAARDIKRNSKNVVDAIIAEDIGKLPDENVAEALQRIPGLTITRSNGEGSQVSVRGIAPNLNRIAVNGKTLTSDGDDQAIGFEAWSAGLLDRVDVIKSPSANMVEGSIGGTVLLKTKMPLDLKSRKIVITAQGDYSDYSEETDPKFAFTYIDQFNDGRFGIAASITYEDRFLRQDGFEIFGWDMPISTTGDQRRRINTNYSDDDGVRLYDPVTGTLLCSDLECHPDRLLPDGTDLGPYGAHGMRAPNHRLFLDERERTGAAVTLDFKPDDTSRLIFDITHSNYDLYRERYQFSTGLQNTRVEPDSIVMGPNNTIVQDVHVMYQGGQLRGNRMPGLTSNNVWQWQETESTVYGLQYEKQFERLHMTAGIGYTDTTRRTPQQYRFSFNVDSNNRLPIFVDLTQSIVPVWGVWTDVPEGVVLPNGGDIANPDIYTLNAVTSFTDVTDDDEISGQLDFNMDIDAGPFTRLYFGVRATEREKDRNADAPRFTRNAGSPGDFSISLGTEGVMAPFPFDDWSSDVSGDLIRSWPIADLDGAIAAFGMTREDLQGSPLSDPDPTKSYVIEEKTKALYLMADYELFDGRMIGDVGVRIVDTENTSSGFFDAGNGPEAGDFPKDYTETLPAFNMRYALKEDLVLRFAAARVMARPTFGEVAPRLNISEVNQRVSGGNPFLDPYISDQIDVALTWYMEDVGMISLGYFYKDIEDFIQKTTSNGPYPDPDSPDGSCYMDIEGAELVDDNGCVIFEIATPRNGESATVKGWELNVQRDFDFLPGILANTGIVANYTYTESEADTINPDTGEVLEIPLPFPGLSEDAYNVILYYEDDRLDVRVSYNYRDDYLASAFGGQNNTDWVHEYDQLDFSASYGFSDSVKGTFEVVNMTNSRKWGYNGWSPWWPQSGDTTRTDYVNYDGTRYRLGVVVSF